MSVVLANPVGLWALLSLPLLVFLHRYVMRGQVRVVSSLALWLDAEQPLLEGQKAERPPLTWVLLLELLAAAALSLLLAGFDVQPPAETAPHLGLVVDGSASMAGGRGDAAPLAATRRVLDDLHARFPDAFYSVVLAEGRPRLLGQARLSASEARDVLAALRPEADAADMDAALALLGALGIPASSSLVLSDDAELEHARLLRVGTPADNVGFVEASWHAGAEPFVVVRSFARSVTKLSVRVTRDGGAAEALQVLALEAGSELPLRVPVAPEVKRVELTLDDDALGIDNRVTLLAPPARGVRLERGTLSAQLSEALQRVERAVPLFASDHAVTSLLVLEGKASAAPAGAQVLRVLPARGTLQHALQLDPFSELWTGVELRGLVWYATPASEPTAGASVVLRSREGVVCERFNDEVRLRVDLERSNLLAHGAFPILMANLAAELDLAAGGLTRSNYRVGEPLSVSRSQVLAGAVTLRAPPGASELQFEAEQALNVGRLQRAGLYTLEAAQGRETLAVNFLDARESELRTRAAPGPMPTLREAQTAHAREGSLLEGPLALLVLGCLGGAFWLTSARRSRA